MGTKQKRKKIRKTANSKNRFFLNLFLVLLILPLFFEIFPKDYAKESFSDLGLINACFKSPDNGGDYVEFLNAGQADCTLIKSGDYAALIDFGLQTDGDKLYTNLLKRGIKKIDLAIITHHHNDHMGGFLNLSEKMKIEHLVISSSSAEDGEAQLYEQVIKSADKNGTKLILPVTNSSFSFGNAKLNILSCNDSAVEENNRSIIIKVNIFGKSILFTGDADSSIEQEIVQKLNLKCDILKMGHHGSAGSSDSSFLKAANPRFAVASCGYDNLYSHPSDLAVERAKKLGITVLRTDLDYNIRFSFSPNGNYTVTTERGVIYDNIR